ncbi:hypothetical protein GLOIN_2v1767205 [Rhizophagus irregularis DAOM 181602=DAOM 197198]|nr:hypothetical protein GLOIN_2v1767205 [Rhizophagus irregularis DAOM 181602=DAOM 197198]
MSKKRQYTITLLAKGIISEDLHYGIYARNWWELCKFDKTNANLIPYRLFMSVNCYLNNKNFAITVLNNEQTQNPCFRCVCDDKDSGAQPSASVAINETYNQIFGNKIKYSGLAVMGFDNESIVHELIADVQFIPIFIRLDKILIVVSKIGISSCEEYYGAGPGYLSTLITKYNGKQSLFIQSILEDECSLDVYYEGIKLYHNKDTTPNKIWETIGILRKYDGVTLFGITNSYVQQKLEELKKNNNIITCTSDNWENIDLLNLIFEQNIKKRKIANTFSDWSNLFTNWYKQTNTIIQFPAILFQIYPENYQFQEKELGAWRAMLRASGCINITPFSKKQHIIEFWTKAPDPSPDRENLAKLFESGMLIVIEKKSNPDNENETPWKSLQKALEKNKRGDDGKVRILSIIAENFTYKKLKEKFGVGNDTINSARKHARLNGPGAPSLIKPRRIVKQMSEIKEKQFLIFFQDRSIVAQSSYKVDKNGLPILYMRDQKTKLWKKFEETFPNGMKKTSFMGRLANCSNIKYRDDMGGLCLTCNEYGYTPFESLIAIARNTFSQKDQLDNILRKIDALKRHMRCGYERELVVDADGTTKHNPCISHCLPYAFGKCSEKHNSRCSECDKFFEFFEFMQLHVMEDQATSLEEIKEQLQYFLAHTTRKVYLNAQFKATLTTLDEHGALLVADYKMRILPKSARETKAEFFGKRGWTLHTILVFIKKNNCKELDVKAYDHWSTDTKQDAWFTASSFEAVFETIKHKPKWIRIISDNGAHYHSSELMAIVAHWNEWYQIEVRDWQFLEPGEAKTTIDSHHAAISHSIKRYIRIGYDIRDGEDIVEAAKHLSGTSLAYLEPNRSQFESENENPNNVSKKELNSKPSVKTIKGISNLFYWKWPISGEMIGYICARSLPHFGPWNNFLPLQLQNFVPNQLFVPIQRFLNKLNLNINSVRIPEFTDNNNRNDELEDASSVDVNFQLPMGWALKSNQKLEGKGRGKRMKKKVKELLKGFFLNGNLNQKDKMSAKDMYNELMTFVESGELEAEDVPKIAMIQNWISAYARTFKEQATENMVNNIL